MKQKQTEVSGISFMGMLTVAFIVLKLTNHIDWSWWWVLSPLWLPVTIAIALYIIAHLIFNQ
jgi:hypothetical protein